VPAQAVGVPREDFAGLFAEFEVALENWTGNTGVLSDLMHILEPNPRATAHRSAHCGAARRGVSRPPRKSREVKFGFQMRRSSIESKPINVTSCSWIGTSVESLNALRAKSSMENPSLLFLSADFQSFVLV
jgi:hypothetical protein